jgi:UDP-N-acetylglucosamine diphosphorylase / glucose-1-phosphate thymidylyltransferase / UDP-N-acetylgalactosamine diphosphorylase / glucosamine-1-phosphate N-acetyltransferase / galactosamine-1-phosphate N-acetyltransferase
MQCVILLAGKGTRMLPLTLDKPKPLIEVAGKTILDHIVEALPPEIDELVLIVGYKGDMIRDYCGSEFHSCRVVYCEQANFAGGTGDALMCAKDVLKGKFLFMYGDDIHGKKALAEVVKKDHAIMGAYMEDPERFGLLIQNEDGTLKDITHGYKNTTPPASHIVNIGGFVVNTTLFDYSFTENETGELYATDLMTAYAQYNPVEVVLQDAWIPIGYPEDIVKAEKVLNQE